jgi:undecaprenyl-diphosphatase
MVASFTDSILHLGGWAALGIIFLIPALEASVFLGFLFPGEIVVILGGVLASQGHVSLAGAIAAAVLGAVVGDSIGYAIGKRWGRRFLHGTLGRLPIINRRLNKHLDAAEAYVRRRKGRAVFFGRFTAALRVLVPGLAGMSEVHYPTFLAYNVAGGALWGAGFVLLGYVAGANYGLVATIASRVGLIFLILVVAGLAIAHRLRRGRERGPGQGRGRFADFPLLAWVRRRFPAQVRWLGERLDPSNPRGFPLTFAVLTAGLAAWTFAGLTQDVVGHDELVLVDPNVTTWVLAHRVGWLTVAMRSLTWLGSTAAIVSLGLLLAGWLTLRRRAWTSVVMGAVTVVGATVSCNVVKMLVERPRPSPAIWIGRFAGPGFPSGHATAAVAFYATAAILLSTQAPSLRRATVWTVALAVILIIGFSRIYLGAHRLTDVLAGYALGTIWVAVVAAMRFRSRPTR